MRDENYFIYAGNPDEKKVRWELIPNTQEAREKAIKDGYTGFSITSFSHQYVKGKKEPNRKGDLWFDFDAKENEEEAIVAARNFILNLRDNFKGFEVSMLRYFISGNKGCHICIPSEMYGDINGSPYLPKIHKAMVDTLIHMFSHGRIEETDKYKNYIDTNLYCQGKGRLLRATNIQRTNGRYKIEVSPQEFFELNYNNLKALTNAPRYIVIQTMPPCLTGLEKIFNMCISINDIHSIS